jgi:hypothetical protein
VLADLEHLDDVWVLQAGHCLRFSLKASEILPSGLPSTFAGIGRYTRKTAIPNIATSKNRTAIWLCLRFNLGSGGAPRPNNRFDPGTERHKGARE